MSIRKLIVLFIVGIVSLAANAAYTVHNVEGTVTVVKKTGEEPATKGMELSANETLVIGTNAKIEIYNSMTKEVYTSTTSGRTTVMDVMMNARKSAGKNLSAINSYVRFGSKERSNTRQYTEGSVKRAMQTYDPEGGSFTIEPRQLAEHVLAGVKAKKSTENVPVEVTHAPMGESGLEFRVVNTLSFPIYLNVLKLANDGAIELSELGQPTGCYVLLPGQAISREQNEGLDLNAHNMIVITHCQFDIDDLISNINDLTASKAALNPDPELPVYQIII